MPPVTWLYENLTSIVFKTVSGGLSSDFRANSFWKATRLRLLANAWFTKFQDLYYFHIITIVYTISDWECMVAFAQLYSFIIDNMCAAHYPFHWRAAKFAWHHAKINNLAILVHFIYFVYGAKRSAGRLIVCILNKLWKVN